MLKRGDNPAREKEKYEKGSADRADGKAPLPILATVFHQGVDGWRAEIAAIATVSSGKTTETSPGPQDPGEVQTPSASFGT